MEESEKPLDVNQSDFNPCDFIDTAATAEILGIKKGTLEVWRHQGKGPEYCKFGSAVRYYKPTLGKFFNQSRRVSTNQTKSE